MTEADTAALATAPRWAVVTYRVAAIAFAAAVAVQVFLAGLAVFTDPVRWAWHRSFSHVFELLPIVMLVVAFAGRLPTRLRWAAGVLFILFGVQYATVETGGAFAALHPVNALMIFWLAVSSVRWSGAAPGGAPPDPREGRGSERRPT